MKIGTFFEIKLKVAKFDYSTFVSPCEILQNCQLNLAPLPWLILLLQSLQSGRIPEIPKLFFEKSIKIDREMDLWNDIFQLGF